MATYLILPENTSGEDFVHYSSTDDFAKVDLDLDVPETPTNVKVTKKQSPTAQAVLCIIKGVPMIFGWIAYGLGMTGFCVNFTVGFIMLFCYFPLTLMSLGSLYIDKSTEC